MRRTVLWVLTTACATVLLAGCGGSDGPETVNGCVIEPSTSCASADLSGADLSGADLSRATLSGANLEGTNLSDANLTEANLAGAQIVDTDLSGADLTSSNLTDATISGREPRRRDPLRDDTHRRDGGRHELPRFHRDHGDHRDDHDGNLAGRGHVVRRRRPQVRSGNDRTGHGHVGDRERDGCRDRRRQLYAGKPRAEWLGQCGRPVR